MRCLIINKNTKSSKALKSYVEQTKFLEFAGICSDIREAIDGLKENKIDLILLDPEMPESMELLNSVQNKYQVIIISNSRKFAAEAYDLDVIDYIVKLTYERFYSAANKAKIIYANSKKNRDLIFIHYENTFKKILPDDIKYVEAYGDYINIVTGEAKYMLNNSLKNLEDKLYSDRFIRSHRKFIVNFHKIDFIEKNYLSIGKRHIPIGRHFREKLFEKLNLL